MCIIHGVAAFQVLLETGCEVDVLHVSKQEGSWSPLSETVWGVVYSKGHTGGQLTLALHRKAIFYLSRMGARPQADSCALS